MEYLGRSHALYAGKYIEEGMVKRARNIITRDYSLYGDDAAAIGQRVKDGLVSMANVTDSYWQTVATNALAQARTYANLATMHAQGVSHYTFVAVLDERTTTICRSLAGKTWAVSPSLDRMERAISATELAELERSLPFVRDVPGADGETIGFAFGPADNPTHFNAETDLAQLAAMGVNIPPLHFYCRSTIRPA
jgi:SPP1 gp7 family putative phage head morphogenesis protein